MKTPSGQAMETAVLGIEGGGTRTSVRLESLEGQCLLEFQSGPAVLNLLTDRELQWHLREIAGHLPYTPGAVAVGLAGVRSQADRQRLERAASRVWPAARSLATNDLETALAAASQKQPVLPRVLVLSGTGSCCYGVTPDGQTAKVGGRGHVIGDRASACDIGLRALRAVIADLDHRGEMGGLGAALLNSLMFNEPEQLIPWSVSAGKKEIAHLAITVFAVAAKGDELARLILADSADMLAEDACACASQLVDWGSAVEFVFNGGVLLKNPGFLRQVRLKIQHAWAGASFVPLEVPSVHGAVTLARRLLQGAAQPGSLREDGARRSKKGETLPVHPPADSGPLTLPSVVADLSLLAQSPTERRNPRSLGFDEMSLAAAMELMLAEDAGIPAAVLAEKAGLLKVVKAVIRAFKKEGRLFYVGAGTSGRLGVLDASEIPPTFRAPREQVQGIIAGGRQALWSAVEGAEDDLQGGVAAVQNRIIGPCDVVVGIAASGRTPFVWGALHEARRRGAFTALICFNPALKQAVKKMRAPGWKPHVFLAPDLGPEVLTGSTRLKSGTATKLMLNIITTVAMTHTGKVISNLMVDLNPSNVKLRDRAVRILVQLIGCSAEQARDSLAASGWVVKTAYESLLKAKPKEASARTPGGSKKKGRATRQ